MMSLVFALLMAGACGDDDDDTSVDAMTSIDASTNAEPVAAFTMMPACTSSPTTQITFTSTSTDADMDTLTCSWVFASGTPGTSTDCAASGITFPHAAFYNVTLTVSDGNGGTDEVVMPIGPC